MKKIFLGIIMFWMFFAITSLSLANENLTKETVLEDNHISETQEHEHEESVINETLLDKINHLFKSENPLSILYILAIIFLLGLFHPLQPGHGKSILFAYLIEKKRSIKDELIFISTMTFSHVFDLIILAIVLKIFLLNIDSHELLHNLQKIGAIILLIMAVYYFTKNLLRKKEISTDHCHKCQCEEHSKSKAPILAFIAGITPCAIGWSIMIILFNLNEEAWIIPSVLIFTLGIWLSLFVLTKIISFSREFFEKKILNISKITNIISPLVLMIVAIFLLLS